jgi:hypothetical protein
MAESILRHELERRNSEIIVARLDRGLSVHRYRGRLPGGAESGLDLSAHRARCRRDLRQPGRIFTMAAPPGPGRRTGWAEGWRVRGRSGVPAEVLDPPAGRSTDTAKPSELQTLMGTPDTWSQPRARDDFGSDQVFAIRQLVSTVVAGSQNAAFRALGLDAVYVLVFRSGGRSRALPSAAGGGGNVTVPHKSEATAAQPAQRWCSGWCGQHLQRRRRSARREYRCGWRRRRWMPGNRRDRGSGRHRRRGAR